MAEILLFMLLFAVIPLIVMGLTVLIASTYYKYLEKCKQHQTENTNTLLGVVMPKQNKGEPNA